jgi:hypothetical protein
MVCKPKWKNLESFAPTVDLITALGRLLRDGGLRDAFALNPSALAAQLHVRKSDQPAVIQLNPHELEFQASLLLRKRLQSVRHLAPETCRCLGERTWPLFRQYSRAYWPTGRNFATADAHHFLVFLRQQNPLDCDALEWNHLQFSVNHKRVALHFITVTRLRSHHRWAMQFLIKTPATRPREWLFYWKL